MTLTIPSEFNLEQAPPGTLDMFAAIIVTATGVPDEWTKVNRELPVRLFDLNGAPAVHYWRYTRDPHMRQRSRQHTAALPEWLWTMLTDPLTTPEDVRRAGRANGVTYLHHYFGGGVR